AMHYTRPELPEECVLGLRLDFRSFVFWRSAPLFSYQEWLLKQDLTGAYRVYRELLKFFQAAAPGKRLTLKAPMHLLDPAALLKVFPEALIVQTHREPLECVPSDQKLTFGFQAGVTAGVDPVRVVEATTQGQLALANRSIAVRREAEPSRIFDISYRQLVANPRATVHAIYAHFGLPMDASVEASLAAYIDENRQYKHGKNRYSLAQFGLKAAVLREQFASYRSYFADYLR
ncbi:MAG: sulfotransferase family protein, partial [Nannocystaceae bacterium]